MKKLLLLFGSALMLISMPAMAQKNVSKNKINSPSTPKSNTPPTKFVEVKDRNFAENLGGYDAEQYFVCEPNANFNKKEWKNRVIAATYTSYDEAVANLPGLPDPATINTQEKMVEYLNQISVLREAVTKHEDLSKVYAAKDSIDKFMMANAKAAAKGQPYEMLKFDPKKDKYEALQKKMMVYVEPLIKRKNNLMSYGEGPTYDLKVLLINIQPVIHDREYFKAFSNLYVQMCHEWFASEECKQIAKMDAPLIQRGKIEGGKKTPQWFVDGRKAELQYVEMYNQRQIQRWMKQYSPYMDKIKTTIPKMLAIYNQIEEIREGEQMTSEYVGIKLTCHGYLCAFIYAYYEWLEFLQAVPMVQTPPTMEGKKFQKYDRPAKMRYVEDLYTFELGE